MVALEPPVDAVLLRYINRLSDLLFVLARAVESSRAALPEDRVVTSVSVTAVASLDRSRLTASKTARASSCDTRSRMAPHSTSTVPSRRFDRHVPPIARDAFGPILEARRMQRRGVRDGGVDTTAAIGDAVDQHADRGDRVLVDRPRRRSRSASASSVNSTRSSAAGISAMTVRPERAARRRARAAGGAGRSAASWPGWRATSSRRDGDDAGDEITH